MKKVLILIIVLILTPFTVKAESKYLYDVLKNEAESNGLAREYTGEHHDSFTKEPSKKIYHWYAETDTEGNQVLEKNNVIFANHCWQMIRTTDTGGVKMIYNGEAVDNQCLSTRGKHIGYESIVGLNLASNYWYGTDYTYDSIAKTFKISGTTERTTWSDATYQGLIGKYTCRSTTETATCSKLYLVESYYNTTSAHAITLNSNSNYSQFGTLGFNSSFNSPSYVGYMYGDVYEENSIPVINSQNFTMRVQPLLSLSYLSTSYWYADSVSYDTDRYSLENPYQVNSTTDYSNLVGKYTFQSSSKTTASYNISYIVAVDGTKMYYIQLMYGVLPSDLEPIAFGDSIRDNGDGTYTINNPTNVTRIDWYSNYANYINKYTCNNSSATCVAPRYTTSTFSSDYIYAATDEKIMIGKTRNGLTLTDILLVSEEEWYNNYSNYSDYKYTCNTDSATCTESTLRMITEYNPKGYNFTPNHYYGSSVTWDGTNYTLVDPIEIENYNNINNISTHHYMCVSNGLKKCATVAYVYSYTEGGGLFYITLKDGVTRGDKALEDMLTKNTTNSTIKSGVDAWYKHYLLEDYDDTLEDTIFCNDRSIRELNGWNPDGGMTNEHLQFKDFSVTSDLSCTNTTDKFSVSNNSAKLTYKVGLMSYCEMNLLNNANARRTRQYYWLASPVSISGDWSVNKVGVMDVSGVAATYGVRPAISLKSSARVISGDGSTSNPYQLSFNPVYSVNVEINNETEDLTVQIDDLSQVPEGEEVKFKVTPIKGHKLTSIKIVDENNNEIDYTTTDNKNYTFTMPATDVTIKPSYERVKNAVNVEDNKNTKEFIIEVNDATAVVYEDTVRFKLEPESGYEVEDIKIIDKEGNEINYRKTDKENEYEFVMPDTDVIIKPKYRLIPTNNGNIINPNTKRQILLIVISALILSIMTIIFVKKKKRL